MRKKKILAVLLSAVLLAVPFTLSANALSSIPDMLKNSSLLNSILDLLGGGEGDGSVNLGDLSNMDLSVLRNKLGEIFSGSDVDLAKLISDFINSGDFDLGSIGNLGELFSNGDFIGALRDYIAGRQTEESTTEPTTEAPTVPPTEAPTAPPATAAPRTEVVTTIVYVYQGAQNYVVPSTTEPPEEMYTYQYVEPATVSVPEITTQIFQPVAVPEATTEPEESDGFSVKTVIGIALLVLSLAAVVVVAIILKKSKV